MYKIYIGDLDNPNLINTDSIIQKFSNLLIGYATSNYFLANKDSEYIQCLEDYVSYYKLTDETILQPNKFISSKDIKESYLGFINRFRLQNIKGQVERCSIRKLLMIDNKEATNSKGENIANTTADGVGGFFFGDILNRDLVIRYFIIEPALQRSGNGNNFFRIVLTQCLREYNMNRVVINAGIGFSDIKRLRKLLLKNGFQPFKEDDVSYLGVNFEDDEGLEVYTLNVYVKEVYKM